MRLGISRRRAVRLRLFIFRLLARLQPARWYIIVVASISLVALAATSDIEGWELRVSIVGLGILAAVAVIVLLTEHYERRGGTPPWWWYARPERSLPPVDGLFQGRSRELADLIRAHDQSRGAGPVLLAIHGKPGVGKSALALALGHRLANQYPHGQIYANLGRTSHDILGDFLTALGWPKDELPVTEVERARLFRSLTRNRHMLFVLDEASDADQVRRVMPSDPHTAVIVTSRQDFGAFLGVTSYQLNVPDPDEAIQILRAVSDTDDGTRPECAARVVQLCGALPLALRAAAYRVSPGGAELSHVAGLLEPAESRLDWLDLPQVSVLGVLQHIASEYRRLTEKEQRALQLLTLVESATFVPWVLVPLLEETPSEAENLVASLSTAQLLDNMGGDRTTGLARYGFPPLVRLFAEAQRVDEISDGDQDAARERLDQAYREVIVAFMSHVDNSCVNSAPVYQYLPKDIRLPDDIAEHYEPIVRAEYPNLVRMVWQTHTSAPGLCWRIAERLDGCVPDDQSRDATVQAYDRAIEAAERDRRQRQDPSERAAIGVLLAKGTFQVAVERYQEGFATLADAVQRAHKDRLLADPGLADRAVGQEVVGLRKIGEAYLQMADYARAAEAFRAALKAASANDVRPEQRLIGMLIAETHHVDAYNDRELPMPLPGENGRFRLLLAEAESARRTGDWVRVHSRLQESLDLTAGHARREGTVRYRMARALLDQHARGDSRAPAGQPSPVQLGIRRAAETVLIFERMNNPAGLVRAQCLLARCLLAGGWTAEAERVAHTAQQSLAALDPQTVGEAMAPLAARVGRVRGEILLDHGELAQGRQLLLDAAAVFERQHDWAAQSQTQRLLRRH